MKLGKEIEKKIEAQGWAVWSDGDTVELSQYSPLGEDFSFCVSVKGIIEEIKEYATYFDAEEHAAMWYENRGSVAGVPDSLRDLIDDADEIQNMLDDLAIAVCH